MKIAFTDCLYKFNCFQAFFNRFANTDQSVMKNDLNAIYTSTALVSQVQDALKGAETIVVPVVNYFDLGKLEELTREYLL